VEWSDIPIDDDQDDGIDVSADAWSTSSNLNGQTKLSSSGSGNHLFGDAWVPQNSNSKNTTLLSNYIIIPGTIGGEGGLQSETSFINNDTLLSGSSSSRKISSRIRFNSTSKTENVLDKQQEEPFDRSVSRNEITLLET
jgi:hypothetical protein